MPNKKITIILVDDHPLLRKALRDVLDEESDLSVIAEASDGDEAIKLALELVPDVVIMDINMPKLGGLEAIRQIKAKNPGIIIMALTVHTEDEYILEILQAGAAGYLVKSVYGQEVIRAIRAVASGDMVLSPAIGKNLLKHAAKFPVRSVPLPAGEKLSIREMEILKLTAQGKGNQEIADILGLNLRTVKGYLTEIFSKLNVSSRTEAVITALRMGIINNDDIQ
jgi:DNA-binding NarL/FixJ family response regulator